MDIYRDFARVYDIFMEDVPYSMWCRQITDILKADKINSGIVADLGCGTGELTRRLSSSGYDMIGIDSSYEMLDVALNKDPGKDILYLCQDIREFELYGTCAAIVSRCDTLNYIIDFDDLVKVFKLVNNYLDPNAPFIFDCNSIYKYEHILSDNTFAQSRDEGSFIWENYYDKKRHINNSSLTFFIKEDINSKTLYTKSEEVHIQRAYSLDELKNAANEAGLLWRDAYDADNFGTIKEDTQRYLICLYENGKKS